MAIDIHALEQEAIREAQLADQESHAEQRADRAEPPVRWPSRARESCQVEHSSCLPYTSSPCSWLPGRGSLQRPVPVAQLDRAAAS